MTVKASDKSIPRKGTYFRRRYVRRKKKSFERIILFRSVVTKLLILPTRLVSFLGFIISGGAVEITVGTVAGEVVGAAILDFPFPAVEVIVAAESEFAPELEDACISELLSRMSTTVALSRSCCESVFSSFIGSAVKRTRKLCSNMSSVRMASVCTSARVEKKI